MKGVWNPTDSLKGPQGSWTNTLRITALKNTEKCTQCHSTQRYFMFSLHQALNSIVSSPPLSQSVAPKQHGFHCNSEPAKAQNYSKSAFNFKCSFL